MRLALNGKTVEGNFVKSRFTLPSGAAVVAVAVLGPEKHIVEHALHLEVVEHFLDLRFNERAVVGIVRAKVSVSAASLATAFAVRTV